MILGGNEKKKIEDAINSGNFREAFFRILNVIEIIDRHEDEFRESYDSHLENNVAAFERLNESLRNHKNDLDAHKE